MIYDFSKTTQECKNNSYQVPDLKAVKKLTAKLTEGKVKEPSASLSPLTLDVSTQKTNSVKLDSNSKVGVVILF